MVEFSNHHTISNGYDGNKRNSFFGQELCNHRNHWKWYDGRVIHEGRWYHVDGTMRNFDSIANKKKRIFSSCYHRNHWKWYDG